MINSNQEMKAFATKIRIAELEMFANLGFGHIGGSLSITDLLAVLYSGAMDVNPDEPKWEKRDRLVMSKGHAGPALYATLALRGFFPLEMLMTLNQGGTNLPSHCDMNKTVGIDMTTGSLGQGFSTAEGIAIALKIKNNDSKVFVVIGDGESQEGQVWEAVMLASQMKLDNLILCIDKNGKQLDGYTSSINSQDNIVERLESFGWECQNIDGNDVDAIANAVEKAKSDKNGKPHAIVLNTTKGKGAKFVEDTLANHHMLISKEQAQNAIKELMKDYE